MAEITLRHGQHIWRNEWRRGNVAERERECERGTKKWNLSTRHLSLMWLLQSWNCATHNSINQLYLSRNLIVSTHSRVNGIRYFFFLSFSSFFLIRSIFLVFVLSLQWALDFGGKSTSACLKTTLKTLNPKYANRVNKKCIYALNTNKKKKQSNNSVLLR